jgi:hypothetical protein
VAAARSRNPSLVEIRPIWVLTVTPEMKSSSAISPLVRPMASSCGACRCGDVVRRYRWRTPDLGAGIQVSTAIPQDCPIAAMSRAEPLLLLLIYPNLASPHCFSSIWTISNDQRQLRASLLRRSATNCRRPIAGSAQIVRRGGARQQDAPHISDSIAGALLVGRPRATISDNCYSSKKLTGPAAVAGR